MSAWSILSAVNAVNPVNEVNAVRNPPPSGGGRKSLIELRLLWRSSTISEKSSLLATSISNRLETFAIRLGIFYDWKNLFPSSIPEALSLFTPPIHHGSLH